MATNDNRAMVEAARAYYDKVLDYSAATIIELMAGFASEQSALAVAAERTRIAAELSIAYPGKGHDSTWLINFIDKLKGATDE